MSSHSSAELSLPSTPLCAPSAETVTRRVMPEEDGAALRRARQRKEKTYPELVGRRVRARLVVLAVEVGGRWSEEARNFLSQLAKARA